MSGWKVLSGSPTPEELAAVVLVLGSTGEAPEDAKAARRADGWSSYRRAMRPWIAPGPGAWQAHVQR